ncbi:hypothetical protein Scep_015149 [Stephania cephalantha]|uniref:Uncharacterized protein n=1 Tax=Stephania cephalantha TaxID=152367 RepID=A0AAP0J4K5_9MAGN
MWRDSKIWTFIWGLIPSYFSSISTSATGMDDRDTAYKIQLSSFPGFILSILMLPASRFTSINPSTKIAYGVMMFAIALLLAWMWPQAKNRTE